MLIRQVQLYKQLFSKSFFFDKFLFQSVYQYPKITSLKVQFTIFPQLELNKLKFSKLVLFFYLVTGERPHFVVKSCNIMDTKRDKIIGLELILRRNTHFFNILITRQLSLMASFFQSFTLTQNVFTFEVTQKIQDDDILFQALQLLDFMKYQVCLKSNSLVQSHLQSLLINLKIPLKNN